MGDNTNSGSEEQTSEFEEDGKDMVTEEGGEDMTGTSEFTVERDVEIEGAGGENGATLGADVTRSIITDNVGSENDSVSII